MIVTPAKHLANRKNARSSTGPRTGAGKRRAAQNSHRHGLVIPSWMAPNMISRHRELTQLFDTPMDYAHNTPAAKGDRSNRLAKLFKSEEALAFISPTLPFYDRPAPRLASAILDLDRLRAERGRVLLSLYETPDDPLLARELDRLLRYGRRFSSQFRAAIKVYER